MRINVQVNGKQIVRSRTPSGSQEKRTPQCEVILTHSLVCRKTKREFIVTSSPDAAFVANLAKHIRMIQPGQVNIQIYSDFLFRFTFGGKSPPNPQGEPYILSLQLRANV